MTMDPPPAVTMIMRAGGDLERVEVEDPIGLAVEVVDIEGTRVEEAEAMGDGGREGLLLHLYTFICEARENLHSAGVSGFALGIRRGFI